MDDLLVEERIDTLTWVLAPSLEGHIDLPVEESSALDGADLAPMPEIWLG